MSEKKHQYNGFTLIELIIVIVILGLLVIIAAPKFLSLQDDAELVVAKNYSAVLQQEIKFVNARWILNGHSQKVNNLQGYSDNKLDLNDFGYVVGENKGEPMTSPFNVGRQDKGCKDIWEYLIENAPTISDTADDMDYRSYRSDGINGNKSKCTYVLRKLGDTGDQDTGKVRIIYESYTGEVSFITQ